MSDEFQAPFDMSNYKGTGPCGGKIEFDEKGTQFELIDDEEEPGQTFRELCLQSRDAIEKEAKEYRDKIWWNMHRVYLLKIEIGEEVVESKEGIEMGNKAAKRYQEKYNIPEGGWNDIDYGIIVGRHDALRWVLGTEWDKDPGCY